ncbi:bifunctional transaldolase/phosoglucose isomerase [Polymorphobacter megasporae]|uniref:bifunctional transaldolase/phosoglucose isomerase n=1 Tax=Glacieibacterium megasporae TaxID=2835787 RepID=UPI001C1E17DC|nr:bifunctional transaldolase/phosoglucose isomerase [Polymorphobacter megasporae]UAJ10541.1 bifunctional transaldolase/phosoglucose isomerase [Polymorphobacter megasporae]
MNRLKNLAATGQAVWLDFVDRRFLEKGDLRQLLATDGVTGVTTNPSIFEKAIGHGAAYDDEIKEFLGQTDASVTDVYESLAISDIRRAAADLRPVYDHLAGRDGYVSFEVSPYLALDTIATISEARRLWQTVGEPNLMIKVPGTTAGVPAIRQLIEDGININVTLLFDLVSYQAVAEAYLAGLEARVEKGEPIDKIASVASFFISRIDSVIDKAIDARVAAGDGEASALTAIRGKVAIASAKLAYAWHVNMIASARWQALAAHGAMPQRLLWASTGVKDVVFPDTLYIDALIGPETVNTMPPATMVAFRDHGTVQQTLVQGVDDARWIVAETARLKLDLNRVTDELVLDGVRQFADATDALLGAVAAKRVAVLDGRLNGMTAALPGLLADAVDKRLGEVRADAWSRRLWSGDATLWTGKDEGNWLGWFAAARGEQVDHAALADIQRLGRQFPDVVLLGMGGSSLGPEVLGRMFEIEGKGPHLHVLDTTDPGQIATVAAAIDPSRCLFIVSSKSGSTMEPDLLRAYFWKVSGSDGARFIAVTDPGSDLEQRATTDGFARIVRGDPAIGGRYSVMSAFGMVPAAAIGLDVGGIFAATAPMVIACGADVPPAANPGIRLGVILGEAALAGRNKLTIINSGSFEPFGSWLEQLIAESTGKQGRGILPVNMEPMGTLELYGNDRLFVHFQVQDADDLTLKAQLDTLVAAGQPLVRIMVADVGQIGQEFFRWEVATAIAGAIIGIDPFDQPDVEDAKIATRELIDAYEATGTLAAEEPIASTPDFDVFVAGNMQFAPADAAALLKLFFTSLQPGGYVGFLAYIERDAINEAAIAAMRVAVRNAHLCATVAGFGPRFLHSTGQVYKGGPDGGTFLTITRDPEPDIAVPGRRATFGTVQLAQARGDMNVLAKRGRHVLRVHLRHGGGGIAALQAAVVAAVRK